MAPKKAQFAASVRRSNRIASKEAVSYTPTTARVVKKFPATKTAATKSPGKKASIKKSAAPKKAPAPKKVPAPKQAPTTKVPISTTPSGSIPSGSKIIKYLTASKKSTSPKKSPTKYSPAKASPTKSPTKVKVSDETGEDERIPTATGLGSPRRLK